MATKTKDERPIHEAKPLDKPFDPKASFERTMRRYPKVMAYLAK